MSLTDRDRKIVLVLAPILVLAAYWFLLLSPKREEAAKAGKELAKQEKTRDETTARASQLEGAKSSFSTDYAAMVRLGKAVPTNVDMPSLIVQLDSAARGTGIRFQKVAAGQRDASATTPTTPAPSSGSGSGSGGSNGNAAAGGKPAQSAPGGSVEQANNTKAAGDKQAGQTSGVDATTSTSSKKGGVPVGGGSTGAAGSPSGTPGACPPGLECVPLDFEFSGSFFDLADFFHQMKRFVKVANAKVAVSGRLMTIDSFKFSTEDESFPKLKAEVTATVYLSPKQQGATAGATPQGPSGSGAGSTTPAGTGGGSSPSPSATPTATATR